MLLRALVVLGVRFAMCLGCERLCKSGSTGFGEISPHSWAVTVTRARLGPTTTLGAAPGLRPSTPAARVGCRVNNARAPRENRGRPASSFRAPVHESDWCAEPWGFERSKTRGCSLRLLSEQLATRPLPPATVGRSALFPPKTALKGSKTVAQMRKKSEQKGCGGTRPAALNKLLEPLGDGSARLGLACCVARGVIKYGSLRCMTEEKLGDYVKRGKEVYEDLGPKSKPHVDFVQRLQAEMKVKNLTRYFYSSMCRCHLDNVTSLLQRVEKKRRLQRVEKKKASKRVRAPAPPQCPICLEDLDDAPALACGHRFHAACVQELAATAWANGARRSRARGTAVQCPLCREQSYVQ